MNRREKVAQLYFYILLGLSLLVLSAGWCKSRTEPKEQHKPLEILGFYTGPEPGLPSSKATVINNAQKLTFIAPFYYRLKADGSGVEKWADTTDPQIKDTVQLAHSKDIKPLALVHNMLYQSPGTGQQAAHRILQNANSRKIFVSQIFEVVKDSGYSGVNLDIENIYPGDRDNLSALVKEMKSRFATANLTVTVCVPAKTADYVNNQWGQNFNYREIGRWADRVVVMTYDEHGFSSGPGPIASGPWVEEVISYSVGEIPKNKILLGVPAYGFDWVEGEGSPRYLSYQHALETAQKVGATPVYTQPDQVPSFTYQQNGQNHQVWYEDSRSFKYKVNLAQQWGLQGIAIWRLGMEDPGIWR